MAHPFSVGTLQIALTATLGGLFACGSQASVGNPDFAQDAGVAADSAIPELPRDASDLTDASSPDARDGSPPKAQENTNALCSNGIDDDGNGYVDCDDFGCSRTASVTVCNTEFNQPLPTPTTNAKPIQSNYLQGASALGWSTTNRLYVGAGTAGTTGGTTVYVSDGHLIEVDPATALPITELATGQSAYVGIAVSPNQRFVVGGTREGGGLHIVDTSGPQPVVTTQSRGVRNNALAFSTDSQVLYAGGGEYFFDPITVERFSLLPSLSAIRSQELGKASRLFELRTTSAGLTAFSEKGTTAMSSTDLSFSVTGVTPPPDGTLGVAVLGAKVIYYSANMFGNLAIPGSPIVDAEFHPNYRTAAVLQADGTLRLVDTVANKVGPALQAHTRLGTAVAFSPDGRTLVSTGITPAIAIFRLK